MAIYTSWDRPDTFQAQRGQETTPCHTELHLSPPPPRFTTPLPEGLLSVGIVTDEEQMELFIMHNYTPTDKQLPWHKTTERNVDRKSPTCHGLVCFIGGGLSTIFTFILPLKLQGIPFPFPCNASYQW